MSKIVKKIVICLSVFASFIIISCAKDNKRSEEGQKNYPWLWEIYNENTKTKSYFFGTLHIIVKFSDFSSFHKEKILESDKVLTSIDLSEFDKMVENMGEPQEKLNQEKIDENCSGCFEELVSVYLRFKTRIGQPNATKSEVRNLLLTKFDTFSALQLVKSDLLAEIGVNSENWGELENSVAAYAKANNKVLEYLSVPEDSMKVRNQCEKDGWYLAELKELIKRVKTDSKFTSKLKNLFLKMMNAYVDGDQKEVQKISNNDIQGFENLKVGKEKNCEDEGDKMRLEKWFEKIKSEITSGKKVFIAAGLNLFIEEGALLEKLKGLKGIQIKKLEPKDLVKDDNKD